MPPFRKASEPVAADMRGEFLRFAACYDGVDAGTLESLTLAEQIVIDEQQNEIDRALGRDAASLAAAKEAARLPPIGTVSSS